jgi:uracil-DNA glycosylase
VPVSKTVGKTRYQLFCERWAGGCGSDICAGARRRVFHRGTLPCDVLFLGEAPGQSEDIMGRPFVGPAGHLLDEIVTRALAPEGTLLCTVAFSNLVCCIPKYAEDTGKPYSQPRSNDIKSCSSRLREYVALADPKLIVCVGAVSRDALDRKEKSHVVLHRDIPMVDIIHPAAILRGSVAVQNLQVQTAVITVTNAAWEHVLSGKEGVDAC